MSHAKECSEIAKTLIAEKVNTASNVIIQKTKEAARLGLFDTIFSMSEELNIKPYEVNIIDQLIGLLTSKDFEYQVKIIQEINLKVSWENY